MHICRKFLSDDILRVMLFIKLCCAFIAYPNIHYVLHCQLIRNLGYVNLLIFSFVILHVGMNVNSIFNVNKFYLAYRVTMPRYIYQDAAYLKVIRQYIYNYQGYLELLTMFVTSTLVSSICVKVQFPLIFFLVFYFLKIKRNSLFHFSCICSIT